MAHINLMKLTEFCKHLAITGGSIAKRKQPHLVKAEMKNDMSLLTEVDVAIEKTIKQRIFDEYPNHNFIGEETGSVDNGSEYQWFLDPLDGTTNYVDGLPLYGTIVSVSHNNKILAAAFYAPVTDQLFWAGANTPTYCNDEQVHASMEADPKRSTLLIDWARGEFRDTALKYFNRHFNDFRSLRKLGTTLAPFYFLASNEFHALIRLPIESYESAATFHLLKQAGCKVFNKEGKPFDWEQDKIMIACSPALEEFMIKTCQNFE